MAIVAPQHQPHVRGLGAAGLRELRGRLIEELVSAVRAHAGDDHLARVVAMIDAVEHRLLSMADDAD